MKNETIKALVWSVGLATAAILLIGLCVVHDARAGIPGKKVCELEHDGETYYIYAHNATGEVPVNTDIYNVVWINVVIAVFSIREGIFRDLIYTETVDIDKINDNTIDVIKLNFIEHDNISKKDERIRIVKKALLFEKIKCN